MSNRRLLNCSLVAAASCLAMASAYAVPVAWTDWTSIGSTSATGTMGGVGVTVTATAGTMNGLSQIGCGTNYWTEPNASDKPYTGGSISNAPTACEQVGLNSAVSITVTFSSAVDKLYMALLSVGQPSYVVTYDFDQAFAVDSEGQGYWGNDITDGVHVGNSLAMQEFHGVLSFAAPVTSLSFRTAPAEYWHAFTFAQAVPEPGTLALAFAAMLGVGAVTRRRRPV